MYQFYKSHVLGSIALLVLLIAGSQRSFGQAAAYPFSQSQGTFTPVSDATVLAEPTALTGTGSIDSQKYQLEEGTLPFPFTFGGTDYTGLWVYADGFISFGPNALSGNTPLSNDVTTIKGAISALATDLHAIYNINSLTGAISYKAEGTAPNREFVIEWKHFRPYNSFTSTTSLFDWNFQIRLKEDNSIRFVYDLNVTGTPSSATAQTGLRGALSSDFNNRYATGTAASNWTSTAAGGFNTSSITCNSTSLPPSGYTFTWIAPVACTAPASQPTAFTSTINGVVVTGNFTAASPAADKYLVLRTPEGTVPNAPVNGTTYTAGENAALGARVVYAGPNTTFPDNAASGLLGNTKYTYTVYAYNNLCLGNVTYNTTTPLQATITTCPAPVNDLSAAVVTASSFTINWVANNGTALPLSYSLEVSATADFTTQIAGSPFTVNAPVLTKVISGLDAATKYYFRITASTTCGSSIVSAIKNVTTACVSIAAINENFNTTASAAIPACWGKIIRGANTSSATVGVSATGGINAGPAINLYNSVANTSTDGVDIILATPALSNLNAGTHRLRFKAKRSATAAGNDVQIGTLTDNSATALFTPFGTVTELTTEFKEYTIYFAGYTGADQMIGFRRKGATTSTNVFIDDVIWEAVPACINPVNLSAGSILPASATITWAFDAFIPAPANGYEYVVSNNSQAPLVTDIIVPTAATSANLTGLITGTAYYIYVRSICSETEKSAWSMVNFTTILTTPVTWTEGFATTAVPAGWNTTGWTIGAERGATGNTGTNIYKNLYGSAATGSFTTINAGLLPANSDLSFDYKQSNYNSPYAPLTTWGKFDVQVSTDFGVNWTTIATVENEAGNGNYIPKTYSLAAYANQYVSVKINATRTAGDYHLSFDNLKIAGQPVSAVPVESVIVTTLNSAAPTITVNQGTLQLAASVLPAQANQGVTWSLSQGVGYATISNTGMVTAIVNGTVTARATSIMDAAIFGEIQITISNQVPVYCIPNFNQGTEPITLVEFAGISNSSSNIVGSATPAYENYTAITGEVTQGQTYAIKLKGNTDGSQSTYYKVYADWNRNGTFDAAEGYELGYINNSTGIDAKELTANITVPLTAIPGPTRLRVMKKWASQTIPACNTDSYGQAEDYTLNITAAPLGNDDYVKATFTVYPNPATDIVTIQSASEIKNIALYSLTGQLVSSSDSITFSVRNLASGMYIINIVFADGSSATKKIIKN